jgi:hypothetical protein
MAKSYIIGSSKHFSDSDETQKGHMKKQHQGVRSTKLKENTGSKNENIPGNTVAEVNPSPTKKMRDIFIKIYNAGKMHSKQTGRLPAMSSKGNQYIMVLVEVDGNYIDAEPMKNKSKGSIIKAYLISWARLTELGTVQPITHILDNKVSEAYKAEIKTKLHNTISSTWESLTKFSRKSNKIIQKSLQSNDRRGRQQFPNELMGQTLTTSSTQLESVTTINIAPIFSAYQYIHGAFDYNKMPLALMGCAVQIHKSSEKRGSWTFNSIDGWYLRASPEHY